MTLIQIPRGDRLARSSIFMVGVFLSANAASTENTSAVDFESLFRSPTHAVSKISAVNFESLYGSPKYVGLWSMPASGSMTRILGVSFDSTEFGITFPFSQSDSNDCPDGAIDVLVDGAYLRDEKGKKLLLKQGDAIRSKGKRVQVSWRGEACKDGDGPRGRFFLY